MRNTQEKFKVQSASAVAEAGLHRAWRLTGFIGALLLNVVLTSEANAGLSSNRYLFIVETSHSMQKRAEGMRQAVTDLLGTGMQGQLQAGDTVGLWTYNNKLHAGMFPLQDWTPEKREAVTSRLLMFLGAEKYEKSPAFKTVTPALGPVVENSDFLTIVIISTGEEKMTGTPFDDRINGDYKRWHDQQQKAHMPFITVLRARNGTITDSLVTPAPFQAELPPLPKPVVAEKPIPTNAPPPVRVAQPLIISGHKPASTTPTEPATPQSIGLGMVIEPDGANSFAEQALAKSSTPPAEKFVPDFPTAQGVPVATAVDAMPSSGAAVPPATPVLAATVASTKPAATLPPKESSVQSVPATQKPNAGETVLRSDAWAKQAPALPGVPQKVLARELPALAEAAAKPVTPAANSVPAASVVTINVDWVAVLVVTGLAAALFFVFARRKRSPAPLSLITRSLERDRK
jgi:hypothetical protein